MNNQNEMTVAIAAFNVSECVRDFEGEIMTGYLISEDLNHWKELEVETVEDLEAWIDMRHGFSDVHKSAYGVRPRFDTSRFTLTEWKDTYSSIERVSKENATIEAEQAVVNIQAFKNAVKRIQRSGAKTFMTAIRWMFDAESVNLKNRRDVECFFYDRGILHTDYGQSLLNRISPFKKR